jgi:hypothetical protein
VNGSFSLPAPLEAKGPSGAYGSVGFRQAIRVNDPFRTGSYEKTLTSTLSTTTP